MASSPRARTFALLSLAGGLLAAVLVGEVGLRLLGRGPALTKTHPNEPVMLEPDSVLGWRNRPGTYAYPDYVRGAPEVRVTIGPDGTRATAAAPVARGDVVDLLGCSFTFGWALSDGRTLAWNLQQALPDLEIRNHGTPAYGTLQSLMALEALLAAGRVPRLVVYDLAELHARRNVAAAQWLRTLAATRARNNVSVPYATMENGRLVRHPPEAIPLVPLADTSASLGLVQDALIRWRARGRTGQRRAVTEALLREMRDVVEKGHSRLLVAWLAHVPDTEEPYLPFLQREGFAVVDCRTPEFSHAKVAGEGHPDGQVNTRWAECLAPAIRAELARN